MAVDPGGSLYSILLNFHLKTDNFLSRAHVEALPMLSTFRFRNMIFFYCLSTNLTFGSS